MELVAPNFADLLIAVIKAGVTVIGIACIYGAVQMWKQFGVSVGSNMYGYKLSIGGKDLHILKSEKSIRQAERAQRAQDRRAYHMSKLKESFRHVSK